MSDHLDFSLRLLTFCALHSLLAVPRVKERLGSLTGIPTHRYRLLYNLLSFVLFGWVMTAWRSTTVLFVAPGVWSLVMYGMQAVLLWAGARCLRQTGMHEFLGLAARDAHHKPVLVTDGCYAVVRHPLYLLGILFLLLNPVLTTRWLVLTLTAVPYLIVGALLEERRMLQFWGEDYRRYQLQVPFIVPRRPVRQTLQ